MKQLTEIVRFRFTKEIVNYLHVLKTVYHIKTSQFVRDAIIEKLERDMPKIRNDYKKKQSKICLPF